MKKIAIAFLLLLHSSSFSFSQDAALQKNQHIVFARTPASSDKPGNASQTFKGDDYIYGRVFFTQSIKEGLFLEKNNEGTVPVDVFVEDLSNHTSLYISLNLEEDELSKTFFDFDILPDTNHILRSSKEFETGRFSFFLKGEGLENKHPVFKFTVGDAVGYIRIDFSSTNLQQVKARDFAAYQKSRKETEGEEKQ